MGVKPRPGGRAAAALAGLLLAAVLAGCAPAPVRLARTETHMGTRVTVTVLDADPQRAGRAVGAAFAEIARLDALLSHYRPDSEVSRLNRGETLERPSEDLRINIERSLEYGRLSGGAFDITVQPILDLYELSFRGRGRAPTPEEVRETLRLVDQRRIRLSASGLSLGEGQKITLGAIAKGYAVDRALEAIGALGVRQALVEAGGDLRAIGRHGRRDWIVGLQDPRQRGRFVTRIRATDRAVVTSGDYERFWDAERLFHHIIDPATGYSPTELISVTIVGAEAMDADALATSVFVLGAEKGMGLIESLEGVEGLLITRDRRILRSGGWDRYGG